MFPSPAPCYPDGVQGTDLFETFAGNGLRGEIARVYRPDDVIAEIQRLIDPTSATATIHWGRNSSTRPTW